MSGFFLSVDGGVNSSSVACIVYSMCDQVGFSRLHRVVEDLFLAFLVSC